MPLERTKRAKSVAVSDRNIQSTPEELRQRYNLEGTSELDYIDSLIDKSNQFEIDLALKANLAGPTFTGTVTLPSTTSIGSVSSTEIGYVNNVTSAIQTQLNAKVSTASIVNDLTTGGVAVPLSAEQGKTLKTSLTTAENNITTLQTSVNGWVIPAGTFTYANANTMNTSVDLTGIIGVGDKFKYTQSGTVKFGYIIAITSSLITLTGGSDYTVANAAISEVKYSKVSNPQGFPQWFNYTPTLTGITAGNGSMVSKFNVSEGKCTVIFRFILGSTSAVTGSGDSTNITLPFINAYNNIELVPVILRDANVNMYFGMAYLSSGKMYFATFNTVSDKAQGGVVNSTNPFTWTTNDIISVSVTYKI